MANNRYQNLRTANASGRIPERKIDNSSWVVIALSIYAILFIAFSPFMGTASAQESGGGGNDIQTSPVSGENFGQLSPVEVEGISKSPVEDELFGNLDNGEFSLPQINPLDFERLPEPPPTNDLRPVFRVKESDEYFAEVISGALAPDISRLGPLPEILENGVKFTDVAADWIYYSKSAGMTDLKGRVMIVYETTIITCDEATLDETNEVYKFFGEGRVFVDDSDFTLECDELEVHDAEGVKKIIIKGKSEMIVFADKDAEKPGENSTKRERVKYALKQQDTKITFTDAEYYYDDDIFEAHNNVRFEQSDKYAQGTEFYGDNKTDYAKFTGKCNFWQKDGQWLYEHKILEDEENPPSKSDRLTRALMAVQTSVLSDEAELRGEEGFLQLSSYPGEIVIIMQEDKRAECELLSLWFSEDEEEESRETNDQGMVNLISEEKPKEDKQEWIRPRGFGELRLVEEYPEDYIPWEFSFDEIELSTAEIETTVRDDFKFEFPEGETTEPGGVVGSLSELGPALEEVTRETVDTGVRRNELIMQGDVFIRQENGDWLFKYDVIREEEEEEDAIEQYKKWANGSADLLHVWMDDGISEASGEVYAEQDNQNLAADFLRYVEKFDMLYLKGNVEVNREEKHHLVSEEGFVFFTTNIFEALGNVKSKVMVDVEEKLDERREESEERETTEG